MTTEMPDPNMTPGASPDTAPGQPAGPAPQAQPNVISSQPGPTFEQRMDRFGQEAREAGERLGRAGQDFGDRLSKDPAVMGVADAATRFWGLVLLAVGLWFVADVTLGLEMPSIPWSELWPIALILVGLFVVFRGMTRRRA